MADEIPDRAVHASKPTRRSRPAAGGSTAANCSANAESNGGGCTLDQPPVGNYFVSAYPPFSAWRPDHLGEVHRLLGAPATRRDAGPLGLYIHFPFCVKRCDYCYYLSYDGKSAGDIDRYLGALTEELALYRASPFFAGRNLSFVDFGGGTPTIPSARRLARLLDDVQRIFPWTETEEVSFECAPKTATEAKLRALHDAGVTRLSIGVQQLDDRVLKLNGRVHLSRDVERVYDLTRRIGFEVVNLDLIVGLVGQTDDSFDRTIDRVIEMEPDSVTIYQLEIPFNTPLYRSLQAEAGPPPPADWATKRARLSRSFDRLERSGYTIRSAYAAVRDPHRHRFIYQDAQYRGADLLGIGASAFSYLAGMHYQNQAGIEEYCQRIGRNELPLLRAYPLDAEERMLREFVLQLKLGSVDARYFRDKFGTDPIERFAEALAHAADAGRLEIRDGEIVLTREGLLSVDRLIPSFYLPQHRGLRYV